MAPRGFTDEEWARVLDDYDRRSTEARRAQGLPEQIEDPAVLDRIAGIVLASHEPHRQPRSA
jgi:hypothetical protein